MTSVVLAPVAQAAGFAIGCYALHTAEPYAARITPYLVILAAILVSLALAMLALQDMSGEPLGVRIAAEAWM